VTQVEDNSLVASPTIRRFVAIVAATTLALIWATTAHAQTSADNQYGSPTDSGETAITQALDSSGDTGSGTSGSSGTTSLTGVSPGEGSGTSGSSGTTSLTGVSPGEGSGTAGTSDSSGTSSLTGVLPETGGPLLPLALLGGLALSSAGVLLARRNRDR